MVKGIYELEMAKEVIMFDEEDANNYLIVDGLNLAFRYKHAKASNFAESYLKTINSFAKSYNAKHVFVLSDWGSSSYRKMLYPEYKADRKEKIKQQTEEEQQYFLEFIEEFNRALELCNEQHLVLKYKGVEADDIAAYLTKVLDTNKGDIWLISSDKDWDMLLHEKIHRFSYVTRKEYRIDNWTDHFDFPHELLLDIKVLQGGKDNVKGIDGIGEKRAATIINKYGRPKELLNKLPLPGKAQYINNLNNFGKEVVTRNLKLIDKLTHCEEAIGRDNIADIYGQLLVYLDREEYNVFSSST